MNDTPVRPLRRGTALLLATLMAALSAVVPLLDSGTPAHGAAFEVEHHATCVPGHDHSICTQFGANLALATSATLRGVPEGRVTPVLRLRWRGARSRLSGPHHRPRAPPRG